ncbi:MAG: MerR family transcriptional regulator [Thermomicrobiales bacterium]
MGLFSRFATRPVYNTNAVVQRTGVPADTFRAWERRYGLPHPARTGGNQRLYSDRDIATITWLRDQTRTGLTISQAVELLKSREAPELKSITAEQGTAERESALPGATSSQRFQEQLLAALLDFDTESASHVFEDALAFVAVEELCLDLIQPCLYEIGERWQRGEIPVSVEHFATAFFIRKLSALVNLARPANGQGTVIAACLEGELHEVGLLMTSLFLARRGINVIYLGPNLPLTDLVQAAEEISPELILLSASTAAGARDLARSSHRIKSLLRGESRGSRVPEIGYGGIPFFEDPSLREQVNGVFCGNDADSAVNVVQTLITRVPA